MDKREKMWAALLPVKELLRIFNAEKSQKWEIAYLKVDLGNIDNFTEWQKQYHGIREGDEYFFVWERPDMTTGAPTLLYVLNVSCESVPYAISELMQLIGDKF